MNTKRIVIIIIIAVLVVAALIYGYRPEPVAVDVYTARRGPMRFVIEEEGKTRVTDRFVVSAPVSGFTRRVAFDAGDTVKKGEVLVEIEPRRSIILDPRSKAEAHSRVKAGEAALLAAGERTVALGAEAKYYASELKRLTGLLKDGFISEGDYERATTMNDRAAAELRSSTFAEDVARYELLTAKTALRFSTGTVTGTDQADGAGIAKKKAERLEPVSIKSPVSGRILRIHKKSEGAAAEGAMLFDIGDPASLEVEVELLSADSVRVRAGTDVIFRDWGGVGELKGKVRLIEPAGFTKVSALGVEEQRVLVISDITSPPKEWGRLGDGYRVEAGFILWQAEDLLQVPASALFKAGDDSWAAFAVENGRAILKPVEIGRKNGLFTEVSKGISEGEEVIVHPDLKIEDGTRVRLR